MKIIKYLLLGMCFGTLFAMGGFLTLEMFTSAFSTEAYVPIHDPLALLASFYVIALVFFTLGAKILDSLDEP